METSILNQKIKSRTIRPQVYALTLERMGIGQAVFCVVAFDLEEAILKAKELLSVTSNVPIEEALQWKLNLFTRKSLSEVVGEVSLLSTESAPQSKIIQRPLSHPPTRVKQQGWSKKNNLIHQIVSNKDSKLFKASKGQFTEAEKKYIEEHL